MPTVAETREPASWTDYVVLARPDHWVQHVFILPGIAPALPVRPQPWLDLAVLDRSTRPHYLRIGAD